MSWARCAGCGLGFTGDTWFDKHRVMLKTPEYDWRCATEAELGERGWRRDSRGYWTGGKPMATVPRFLVQPVRAERAS